MEQETLQVGFDAAKLDALRFYMGERGITPETELQNHMEQLYEKHVPAATRRYLNRHDEPRQAAAPQAEQEPEAAAASPRRSKQRLDKGQKAELKVVAPAPAEEAVVDQEPELSGPVMSM